LNLPNALTLLRIFLVPLLVVVLLTRIEGHVYFGAAIFLIAVLTDYLDGFFARRRNEVTRLGILRAFSSMDLEGYYDRQLSNVLITNVQSNFRKVMNPRHFRGRLQLDRAYCMRDRAFWECTLAYSDDEGGAADGTIVVTMSLGDKLAPKG